ncbi:E3 ubiquitin-protein ligase E3D isoform X2 [Trichechus manatus latirostris]|uniref:E3 ubiquitin-protein ligase E3D n=1 Tax=Trichechus manatus latirostris TaxID=127582 RepID=A0A2Y9RWW1_TRIMA|nr:E3 ubiquitin-protein ligase E3D isoform X2 [Trichechus manatus latirostris]
MTASPAAMRVFLEVRRRLQSALLILGEPKEGDMPVDISVMPSSLQMRTPGSCTELWFPAEVRLVPSSCRGLQYVAGDGLHLRLQTQAELSTKPLSLFTQSPQVQECCTFYCQSCGEVIIRDRKLLRVLPLPSENWGALVGEWCCHPDPFANKPLHPQENDCFTGDSFFLVNLRSNSWQPRPELGRKPKTNTKVICKRCKVMLGETMSSETTKLYMTEIIIQPSERNFPILPRSQFVQSVIAQCLVELSSARSTFRFTIQGHDGKAYVLLWLLNSDSLVIESLGNSKSIKKFPLLEDILKDDSSSAWNAIKVLYQPCIKNRNKKLAGSWESDISIHSLTLPAATCLELLLILSRSNAMLPPSLRYMNSFQGRQEIGRQRLENFTDEEQQGVSEDEKVKFLSLRHFFLSAFGHFTTWPYLSMICHVLYHVHLWINSSQMILFKVSFSLTYKNTVITFTIKKMGKYRKV